MINVNDGIVWDVKVQLSRDKMKNSKTTIHEKKLLRGILYPKKFKN